MQSQWNALAPGRMLASLIDPAVRRREPNEHEKLLAAVAAAQREWHAAMTYFENVSDPDLVDHAIFVMEAAKRKYMYLIKQTRRASG